MKIKDKLNNLASKQEIHDLSNDIINKVDTSKVVVEKPVIVPRRSVKWVPILAGAMALAVVVGVGVTIPFVVNNGNSQGGGNITPTTPTTETTTETESNSITQEEFDEYEKIISYLGSAKEMDAYNIINIVKSFNNITYDVVNPAPVDNTKMTADEEQALVNDIDNYFYNIEEMLGIKKVTCASSINISTKYAYAKVITIDNAYSIYFNEEIIEEKNKGKTNYKYKAEMNGIVVYADKEYPFEGTLSYGDSKYQYLNTVHISDTEYVLVDEKFKPTENLFTYTYYNNGEEVKKIIVDQNLNDDGTTNKLSLQNQYTKIESFVLEDDRIACKIKSRESDYVYITKNETDDNVVYTYTFKNSNKEYLK